METRSVKYIFLVRHGQTEWNADRRPQGQTGIALNDRGRDQARSTSSMILAMGPDIVVTSDLARGNRRRF